MAGTVTLSDVAKAAGVSLATASRAFNGSASRTVREDLRERVMRAAAELSYVPNAHAQAMVRGSTDTVGLIVADIADPYFSSIAAGVMAEASRRGLIVSMTSTLRDFQREIDYLRVLRQQRAHAAVLVGSRPAAADPAGASTETALVAAMESFTRTGGRVAAITQPGLPVHTLALDNHRGAADLARALHGLGYRRFAVLSGPTTLRTAVERTAGFLAGLSELGVQVPPEAVVTGGFTRDGGYAAARELLERGPVGGCLFAVNDVMAVGAMAALRDTGHALPGDVAVAGFDDIETLRDVTPALTTVRVPLEDMGAQVLRLAADSPREGTPVTEHLVGEVVLRASTPAR